MPLPSFLPRAVIAQPVPAIRRFLRVQDDFALHMIGCFVKPYPAFKQQRLITLILSDKLNAIVPAIHGIYEISRFPFLTYCFSATLFPENINADTVNLLIYNIKIYLGLICANGIIAFILGMLLSNPETIPFSKPIFSALQSCRVM